MPLLQLVALQLVIFVGLILFLRHILTRNISRATGHLTELSSEYISKQEAINKRLEEAKVEAQDILTVAKRESEELRVKTLKEALEQKEAMLKEAHQKGEQMVERAERACEMLKQELDKKIDERARGLAYDILMASLPETIRHQLHTVWVKEASKIDFQSEHLNFPHDISEIRVISAYPLSVEEKNALKEKIEKRIKNSIELREEVDRSLIAGYVVHAGSVVIDGSLRFRIDKAVVG